LTASPGRPGDGRSDEARRRGGLPAGVLKVALVVCLALLLIAPTTGAWDGNGRAEAAWAELQVGLKSWRTPDGGRQQSFTDCGWCGRFVAHAYGATKVGFKDAKAMKTATLRAGSMRYGSVAHAPVGAIVFYDLSKHGHVGIHVGDGYVVHAGYGERVRRDYWNALENYAGWTYPPPAKWPGRSSLSNQE
jgi:uncharacterized protein (DUF2147 family)